MDVTLDCGTDDFQCSNVNTKHNRTLKINQERKLGTEEQHNLSVCYIYGTWTYKLCKSGQEYCIAIRYILTSEMVMQCQGTTRYGTEVMRFEIFKTVLLKIQAFWGITLCWWESGSLCFRVSQNLHILGQAVPEDPKMLRTTCPAAQSLIPDDSNLHLRDTSKHWQSPQAISWQCAENWFKSLYLD
jgi:hypothetical protein